MRVIDVDSHFYEPLDWLTETAPALAARCPALDPLTLAATTAFGDIITTLPGGVRPDDPLEILPKPLTDLLSKATPEARAKLVDGFVATIAGVPGAADAKSRIEYLDQQGIDYQFVLPTFAFNPISRARRQDPALAPALIRAYNRWACERLAGEPRLAMVSVVDLETMDRSQVLEELEETRRAGSRSFSFWVGPMRGKSLAHPDFEWLWACAEDLGLFPMLHVGAGRPGVDIDWLRNGRQFPSRVLAYMTQLQAIAEVALAELIYGGVLERHPKLRLLVCELGVAWIPGWLERIDRIMVHAGTTGRLFESLALRPSEYARRQIRVSPVADDPVAAVIDQPGGEMIVFASDYPHVEGGANAITLHRKNLDGVAEAKVSRFFGETIQADLALGE
jgi:predicted TIM-barrel fold metal-dependent hydrolase